MNDRAGARRRKTKPPPASRYLRREGRARAAHSPGAGRRRRRLRVGTRPRGGRAPPQSTRPAAPAPSGRSVRAAGKAGGRGRRRASHAAPRCGGRCPGAKGTLRCRRRPRDPRRRRERRGATAERGRGAPQRLFPPPSAAGWVSARLCAGIFLRSQRHSELLWRLLAAAHPRVTPRPPRDPPIVSSQHPRRRGRAKPCLPPALERAPGVRAPRGGFRASSAAPSGSAASGSPALALLASPASSAPARPRLPSRRFPPPRPASLPPAGLARAPAPTNPCAPALGERRAGPLTSGGAGAPPARRLGSICPHLPAGHSAGGFLHVGDRGKGAAGQGGGREGQPDLGQLDLLGKVRARGAGTAERRTNPEAAEDPELLSYDAEGQEGSERRRAGRRPSEVMQAGLCPNPTEKPNGGGSCLGFPNCKGKTVILMSPTRGVVTIKNGLLKVLRGTLPKEGTKLKITALIPSAFY